jgi:hypothetical protein
MSDRRLCVKPAPFAPGEEKNDIPNLLPY